MRHQSHKITVEAAASLVVQIRSALDLEQRER